MLAPVSEELNLGAKLAYEASQRRRAEGSKRRKLIAAILAPRSPCDGCQWRKACDEERLACWQFAKWCHSYPLHVTEEQQRTKKIKSPTREVYGMVFQE